MYGFRFSTPIFMITVKPLIKKRQKNQRSIANICWIIEKNKSSRKTSALLTTLKTLTLWITTNCGKFLKRWEYQTILPASWEICMQVKKQQLDLDMERKTGSKLGKEYVKAVYCHPAYLTYMQSTSSENAKCWAGWSISWNQDCLEKYQ